MKDTRDLRDPEEIGRTLLYDKSNSSGSSMSFLADRLPMYAITGYDGGPYMSAPPEEHHMYGFDFSDTEPGGD